MDKTICLLFGAGAEADMGLPLGSQFLVDILKNENVVAAFEFFNSHADKSVNLEAGGKPIDLHINKSPLLSTKATDVLYQTINENENWKTWIEDEYGTESEKASERIKQISDYKKGAKDNVNNKAAYRRFQNAYKEEIYDKIVNFSSAYSNDGFLCHANFFSYLDENLNCLRLPSLYPRECGKVLRFIYGAFVSVVSSLEKDGMSFSYRENRDSLSVRRNKFSSFIANYKFKGTGLGYYDILRDSAIHGRIRVITTNYTKAAESIIGIDPKRVAYIHGRLDLFEDLKTKEVRPIAEYVDSNNTIFPFIFVPSGVKPIVHPFQIKEYTKAESFLSEADDLMVVGLNLLGPDEHVITMIRERLKSGRHVTVFLHGLKENDSEPEKIKKLFSPYEVNLAFKSTNNFKQIIELMN